MSCPRWSALCFCDQGISVIRTQATRGGFRFGGHACLYAVLYIWLNTRHCRVSLPPSSSRHAPRPLGTRSPLRQTLTLSLYLSREGSNNLVTVTDRFTRPGPRPRSSPDSLTVPLQQMSHLCYLVLNIKTRAYNRLSGKYDNLGSQRRLHTSRVTWLTDETTAARLNHNNRPFQLFISK